MDRRRLLFALAVFALGVMSVPAVGQSRPPAPAAANGPCPTMKCSRGVNVCATTSDPTTPGAKTNGGTFLRP